MLVAFCVPQTNGAIEQQSYDNRVNPQAIKGAQGQGKSYTFADLLNKDPGAIANEKRYFDQVSDPELKQRVASILLNIGVRDDIYFEYLVAAAKQALEDETPWPFLYDENGERNTKSTNPMFVEWMKKQGFDPNDSRFLAFRGYNPTFLDWCKNRGKEPNETRNHAEYVIPVPWAYLGAAADPRAYDLLVRGLHSHNLMIVANAAQGLAILQDRRAIPELIASGRRLPGEARHGVAWSLLYFSDARAQAAANELEPDKKLLDSLRAEVQKRGVKGLLPW